MDSFNFSVINPIRTEIFLAGVAPPPQPFVLKLHDSNFVQNYFGVQSIFWNKNPNQIDNDVTITFLCSVEYQNY